MKTLNRVLTFFLVLMFTLIAVNSRAALDSKGTDFWLMFNGNLGTPTLEIFITSDVNTSGSVDIPGLAITIPFSVTANTVTTVSIPGSVSIHTSDVIDAKGVHITALQEVTVYGLNYIPFTTDAYLGLPTDILGTDYIILTYRNSNIVNGVEFGIVGTQNTTSVTITPSVTTGPRIASVPYVIVLNEGDTYELRNTNSAPDDLSGTTITSDKPIGVMGAHQCANIPAGAVYCDHICEMLPPTSTWGKNFVTVPLKSRVNGDTWIMMASQNGTTVSIDGVAQPIINSGQRIETILTGQSIISSDKPILVAQYSNGSSFSGNPGDPFMMIMPPYEQYLAGYTLTTVTGYVAHYINVVAPNAVVGTLTLDLVPVPVVEFTPIGISGFSGAQLTVAAGSHTLAATLPFGAFQYGFNNDDSYGYPGGLSLAPIATVTSIDLTPEDATNPINTLHCVDALVLDQLGVPVVGVRVDFLIKGVNAGAGFAFTNTVGIAQYCYTGLVAGRDTIIGSTGNLADTVFKTWTGGASCDPGTPHIEILDNPKDTLGHLEGCFYYEKVYDPYFPSHFEYSELHCGMNNLKPVDPCNPWVLSWYVAFFEDENDMVKVRKPVISWDTTICQDMRYEVVYPDNFDYTYSTYYDSVVMKVTMIPHPVDGCTDPSVPYVCYNGDTIYNWSCWRDCIGELITFQCIDSCPFPNTATCLMNFDKPLPVELNSFTALVENENVILTWATASEKNNAGFEIERRAGSVWEKAGYIAGKGNSEVQVDYTFIDRKLNSGSYFYRLKQIDFNGNFNYYDLPAAVNIGTPDRFKMSQNYPNPFNPATKIDIAIPNDGNVMLKIYDLSGREIVTVINEFRSAGYYTVDFNAADLASGMYYYRLTSGNNTAVNKMVVLK